MKTLNLAYPEKSDIKYEIIYFPDGEKQINILDPLVNMKEMIFIKTRIRNADDLFILLQVYDIFKRHCLEINVKIMYLMSQRNDRLFSYGRAVSTDIVYKLISNADRVFVLCPHNKNKAAEYKVVKLLSASSKYLKDKSRMYFYPDSNAKARFGTFSDAFGEKVRDVSTGKITNYKITIPDEWKEDKFDWIIVYDDLCDGGYTFKLAYEKLKERFPDKKLALCVTHAVQEEGLRSVCDLYDEVIVSNSFDDWDKLNIPNLKVIDVWD